MARPVPSATWVTDEYAVAGGRRRDFQSGFITWNATSGATTVTTPAGQCTTAQGCTIIRVAASLTGILYGHGGHHTLRLHRLRLRQGGITIPRTSEEQRVAWTKVSNPVPGDLIVFGCPAYHVGIFAGGGTLHDSQRRGTYSGLHDIWTYTNVSYGWF